MMLLATNWTEWTAIGTLIAAGAAMGLAAVTGWLVLTTRGMVSKAGEEIAVERRRIDEATKPHVFPAPTGDWGDDGGYTTEFADRNVWRTVLPVTNGGPGVALNVKAQLRWGPPSGILAETVPTSLGPGESRNLVINWGANVQEEWLQVQGALYYEDVSGALWETNFRVYGERERHFVEVQQTRMVKSADGTVVGCAPSSG
jgi:hypothetical protein